MNNSPLLSICIPTYNREEFLSRLMLSILPEVCKSDYPIEIIISDNASTDNTYLFCNELIKKYPFIQYYKSHENKGSDFNISNVYIKAKGHFVWVIGDDDYLVPGALSSICNMLNNNTSTDLIYLKSRAHEDKLIVTEAGAINYTLSEDRYLFAKKIGVFFTFISGVIINKSNHIFPEELIKKYSNTSLIQLSWVFNALKNGNKFIIVNNQYVMVQPDNTGGYKLFTVFSKNLSDITNDYFAVKSPINKRIRKSAMRFLLSYAHMNTSKNQFKNENCLKVCNDAFKDIPSFLFFYQFIFKYKFAHQLLVLCKSKLKMIKDIIC